MKRLLWVLSALAAIAGPAEAATLNITPGIGATLGQGVDGSGNLLNESALCGSTSSATLYAVCANQAIVNGSGELWVDASHETLTISNPALGVVGSAPPGSAVLMGANANNLLRGLVQTGTTVVVEPTTATTTQIVGLVSGNTIEVTSYEGTPASGTWQLVYGTGTACASGTTKVSPLYTGNGGQQGAGVGIGSVIHVPSGNALCIVTTGSAALYSTRVSYSQSP